MRIVVILHLAFYVTFASLLPEATAFSTEKLNTVDDMRLFMKTAFIQKETGFIPAEAHADRLGLVKKYAEGFNPSWAVYRFHHVCLRGGSDGLYTGMTGVAEITQPHSEYSMTLEEWNEYIGSRFSSPISAATLDDSHFNKSNPPTLYHNSTLFTNCNRQHSMAFNPSHLMMNVGWLYEYAECTLKNFGRQRIFKHDFRLPFRQFMMHQCPDPAKSYWQWGQHVLQAIEDRLYDAFLISKDHTKLMRRGKENDKDELMCFDDLYLSSRTGHWLEGTDNYIKFKRDIARLSGEPAEAVRISERAMDVEKDGTGVYQSYCTQNQQKPTNARIKLFQRTENLYPRTISNEKEVIDLLQSFTTHPVDVVTTSEKMTMAQQIRVFNDFDILVTTHGAHLANGIFSMHPYALAIVEIVPFVYDSTFFRNYDSDIGFADYVISSGHLTPRAKVPNGKNGTQPFCAFLKYQDFQNRKCTSTHISNPPRLSQEWMTCTQNFHSRSCDTYVNITILQKDMNNLITKNLCHSQNTNLVMHDRRSLRMS